MNRILCILLCVASALVALVGCGGGGGGSSNPPAATTVPASFAIDWGARSRDIQGPSSALSATLTLTGATAAGGDLAYTVNRNPSLAAYTGSYTTNVAAKIGTHALSIVFYSAASGGGTAVASGSGTVTIASNGSGIGTITVTNKVTSVAVTNGQTIPSGGRLQLTFSALDSGGNLVAVSAGSALWTQVSGQSNFSLTSDGAATALQNATSGNVQATVDGVTSAPTLVSVAALPVTSVVIDLGQTVSVGQSKQLTFKAYNSAGDLVTTTPTSVDWEPFNGVQDPDISITTSGVVTGIRVGTATFRLTVSYAGQSSVTSADTGVTCQ